ncbi:winged helix DNA-binding domain-containing protein [Micromonospora polyrhachis]|uniref:Winged helix DNA-binding domain-containing protein n=1 Tax=Micromonospora polyrhachis TaxID=1282883 RepID=A0A7W7SU90_9ACTN|nr:winged helix DNA-binding domain-containing protein [Micromonospora polyrhachis]MBB4959850.1 hypothetical protein [Micromonospora polyrhachis]
MNLTSDNVLAWRMRRHYLDRVVEVDTTQVVRRLCGLQAQVISAAERAVAARLPVVRPGLVAEALADRRLVKTWAMRGTLHLLTPADAPAYLSLLAAARTWEKGSWQRTFVTVAQLDAIAEATLKALDGRVLTREELTAEIVERTGDATLQAHLGSGWGAVLKPLAWQGLLVNGPSEGNRVTFTRPDTWLDGWSGLPAPDVAAQTVIPNYLGAYGPATPEVFDQWLCRGATKKATLRGWFGGLVDAGTVVHVEVDDQPAYARAADVDEIAGVERFDDVRLLPAFDHYVLGPGTNDTRLIPAARRGAVSRAAGWISPVVVHRGRVAGTWDVEDGALDVALFAESGPVPTDGIEAEVARLGAYAGTELQMTIRTD